MNNYPDSQPDIRASDIIKNVLKVSVTGKQGSKREKIAWALLRAMAAIVIVVNRKGTILWINQTASKQFNKSIESLTGSSLWDVYPAHKVNHHKILLNQVIKSGHPVSFIDKERDRWFESLFFPISNEKGKSDEVVFYVRDITVQIEAEEALKRVSLQLVYAQESERQRISQDLHDEIGQQMIALLIELNSIQKEVGAENELLVNKVDGAIRNLEDIMKHLRQIFYQLYPPSLYNTELTKVLDSLCSTFARSTGIYVDFNCTESLPSLLKVHEVTLYRFVQEGLANTAKHGKAKAVWINLTVYKNEINISIEDDGLGFDLKSLSPGLGIKGMQDRFLMLKGSFEIDTKPGKGTKIFGSLPLTNSEG